MPEQLGLRTLEDISALILQSHDLDETLTNIVSLVARRMKSEVCSIYLLDDDQRTLRLRATCGLAAGAVGKVSMGVHEGLAGLAVDEGRVVSIQEPESHPRYRYFAETGEERYHSFLGIPLFDRRQPLGVIVIQTTERRDFTEKEISALSTIAFQVASIVVNARLLDTLQARGDMLPGIEEEENRQEPEKEPHPVLKGQVASPGVAIGPAHLLDERLGFTDILDEDGIDPRQERQRLHDALEKTRIQTLFLEKRVSERLNDEDAAIFHTHLMILEDRSFLDKLDGEIARGHSAPYALKKVVGDYLAAFSNMEDAYLRERAADMDDIGRRILASLVDHEQQSLHLKTPGVIVARELLPSDMAALDHEQILGIVTEAGENNSHAVIMAKSLGIPALVGVKGLLRKLEPEAPVILDANSGTFYIRPAEHIVEEYRRLEEDRNRELHKLDGLRDLPAITRDGTGITLRANIGLVSDVDVALRNGASGVGLYRTEFPYMARGDFPDRQDQYRLYRKVVEGFAGQPITIRTLDIGGDKVLPYFAPPAEDNPFMGWRSVRVSLDNPDIFSTQIEAILMAGIHGPVKMLFPMISSIEEVKACRAVVSQAKQTLSEEGIPFAENMPLGVMIEVPATIHIAHQLAELVDFFALGTNDLVQYLLAADRNNPLVNKYYDPLHPAVLQAIRCICEVAAEHDKGLCLCGEMATDPLNLLALVGLGLREFSMPAPFIPRTKAFLRDLDLPTAENAADKVLKLGDSIAIRSHLIDILHTTQAG
ncbi:phosphoenolpyruvate--protein phosphotransferase [Geothermobacter hydrogeniphilus]|uniref:phosphoenolpyruvate--protein phosphotransferase n=1 Tax=Geothermobacter hydrogeniphilus TaxID=1969733 RepID=A0A1X0Y629_9BACT|nr:phosphoenolpyruvate--protein phosphotransferase [Geothermobacter hydrogeniphilus]ORJ60532.1 diguanylate phosphodiesterase [Geothermobacter hydrogeniphilus]